MFNFFHRKENNRPHRLVIMRHAQADTLDLDIEDRARNLSTAGREQLGDLCSKLSGHSFDKALVSSATRTQQTYGMLANSACTFPEQPSLNDELYHCDMDRLNDIIAASKVNSLLVVAHNPSISDWLANHSNILDCLQSNTGTYLSFVDIKPCTFVALYWDEKSQYRVEKYWSIDSKNQAFLQSFL